MSLLSSLNTASGTNPYQIIGNQHAQGLAYIENNLTLGMDMDHLSNLVFDFVQPLYFPNPPSVSQFTVQFGSLQNALLDLSVNGNGYLIVNNGGTYEYTTEKTFIVQPGTNLLVTADTGYILQSWDGISLNNITIPSVMST